MTRTTTGPRRRIRQVPRLDEEHGSLILDILIGMAIFALIAIIAVSAISQYRMRAYEQAAVSDAKALGTALEADYTDDQTYPADTAGVAAQFADSDGTMTKGVTVEDYVTEGGKFALCVEHESGGTPDAWAVYNNVKGGLADSGREAGCESADVTDALDLTGGSAAPGDTGDTTDTTGLSPACAELATLPMTTQVRSSVDALVAPFRAAARDTFNTQPGSATGVIWREYSVTFTYATGTWARTDGYATGDSQFIDTSSLGTGFPRNVDAFIRLERDAAGVVTDRVSITSADSQTHMVKLDHIAGHAGTTGTPDEQVNATVAFYSTVPSLTPCNLGNGWLMVGLS